jgi:hypothetical protein
MILHMTEQEVLDLVVALGSARAELCTGEGFEEANAIEARWEHLEKRLHDIWIYRTP